MVVAGPGRRDGVREDSHSGVASRLSNTRPVSAVRRRYPGSVVQDLGRQLSALDFVNQATLIGAGLLASLIPLMVLLSAFANQRVDEAIALRLGLNHRAARIVSHLFRSSVTTVNLATVTSLIFVLAGTVAVASSMQQVYEKAFRQPPRGARNLPRLLIWVPALCGLVTLESMIGRAVHDAWGSRVLVDLLSFALLAPFFWWTIHFMLAGRVPWRRTLPSAIITGALFGALAFFSELYFSTTITTDSRTFGAIGTVLSLLTWLVAVAIVIIVGAVGGAVWADRRAHRR